MICSRVEALVPAPRIERLVCSWIVERLERLLSVVPSTSRGPVVLHSLVTDSNNVAGVVSVAAVPAVVSTVPGDIVSVRTTGIVSLIASSCSRIESLISSRVVPGAEVPVDDRVLREVVGTGAGGAAGESSLVTERVALVAHVGGGTAGLTHLPGHHPALLVRNILALRPGRERCTDGGIIVTGPTLGCSYRTGPASAPCRPLG